MRFGRKDALLLVLLAVCTASAYARVGTAGFVTLDDPQYILDNPMVRQGVTAAGLRQAFTAFREGNWHPITWISHMLDVSLFGMRPLGHHLVSLGLHVTNMALLFLVLKRMTAAVWPCAFAAAIFALHPLRVESVAWVAERKDVLSGLFFMLSLGAYTEYSRMRGGRAYAALLCFFALGLAAKPMLVTLPFLLLLLDYWPLGRLSLSADPKVSAGGSKSTTVPLRRLLLEKVPLLALALASSVVTYFAQQRGNAINTSSITLADRLANAPVSAVRYLGKSLWPVRLGVFYPFPREIPAWQLAGAVLLLTSITFIAVVLARRRPFFVTGWFWFLGMLVPVSGVVLVGGQAMADRYLYLPGIGLGIIGAWGLWTLAGEERRRRWTGGAAAAILAALIALTVVQTGYWQDSFALYRHAIEVAPDNYLIRTNLGIEYSKTGKFEEALREYTRVLEQNPAFAAAWFNLGLLYGHGGRYADAADCLTRAVHLQPSALAHANLGLALELLGRLEEAVKHDEEAVRLDPENRAARANLASVRAKLGRALR